MRVFYIVILLLISCYVSAQCDRQYMLNVDTKMQFKVKNKVPSTYHFFAVISIKKIKKDGNKQWWGIKADNATLSNKSEKFADLDYEQPFAFALDEQGSLVELWFNSTLSQKQTAKLASLAYYFQGLHSSSGESEGTEIDSFGEHIVRYSLHGNLLSKQKIAYGNNIDTGFESVEIQQSTMNYHLDSCLIETMQGNESYRLFPKLKGVIVETSLSVELIPTIIKSDSALFALGDDFTLWAPPQVLRLTKPQLAQLTQQLRTHTSQFDPDLTSGYELAQQLANYDMALDALLQEFVSDVFTAKQNKRLLYALGILDTPSSQMLLINLLASNLVDDDTRFRALRALTIGDSSLEQFALDTLSDIIDNGISSEDKFLQGSLLPSLGTMIGNREPNEVSITLRDRLVDNLAQQSNAIDKSRAILALGNTQDTEVIDTLSSYGQDSLALIRGNTAVALGQFSGNEQVYSTLSNMLSNEVGGQTNVQVSIMNSLGKFEVSERDANVVYQYAHKSNNANVRKSAIKLLIKQPESNSKKEMLKSLIKTERNLSNLQEIVNSVH